MHGPRTGAFNLLESSFEDEHEDEPLVADFGVISVERSAVLRLVRPVLCPSAYGESVPRARTKFCQPANR